MNDTRDWPLVAAIPVGTNDIPALFWNELTPPILPWNEFMDVEEDDTGCNADDLDKVVRGAKRGLL